MDNMKVVHSSNLGDTVICDFCNADGSISKGGVMIGSNAVCGDCCDKYNYYNDKEVDEVFDREKTFQENVCDYRKKTTGTSDGIMQILTWLLIYNIINK